MRMVLAALAATALATTPALAADPTYGGFFDGGGNKGAATSQGAHTTGESYAYDSYDATNYAHGTFDAQVGALKTYAGATFGYSVAERNARNAAGDPTSNVGAGIGAFAGWNDAFTIGAPQFTDNQNGTATIHLIVAGAISAANAYTTGGPNVSFADPYVKFTATSGALSSTFDLKGHSTNYGYNAPGFSSSSTTLNGQPQMGFFGTYDWLVPFISGQQIAISGESGCVASVHIYAANNGATLTCDLAHSVYWGGIGAVTDSDGNAVADFTTSSDSGFNYAEASPALNAAADVPEPSSWALMILGFGAIGVTQRRARRVAIT